MSFMDIVKHPLTRQGVIVLSSFVLGAGALKAKQIYLPSTPSAPAECKVTVDIKHEKQRCPDVYLDNVKIR